MCLHSPPTLPVCSNVRSSLNMPSEFFGCELCCFGRVIQVTCPILFRVRFGLSSCCLIANLTRGGRSDVHLGTRVRGLGVRPFCACWLLWSYRISGSHPRSAPDCLSTCVLPLQSRLCSGTRVIYVYFSVVNDRSKMSQTPEGRNGGSTLQIGVVPL